MITLRATARADRGSEAPAHEPRRRPHLRVVDEVEVVEQKRSAGGVVATMTVVLLFVCVFGVVVFQVFLVQAQSHLDQLNRDIATQEGRTKDLRLQTTNLESPDRIVKDARERLGMIPPRDIVYLQPKSGDDDNARFDASKEPPPAPTTVPPAASTPTSGVPFGPGPAVYGADGSLLSGTPGVTAPKGSTTATTTAKAPTTTKTTSTTTVAKATTTAPKTTTTVRPTVTTAPAKTR